MQEIEIIKPAKISFPDYNGKIWIRSETREGFDIAIGSSDSKQTTDLVGYYLMEELRVRFPDIQGGLYRDDVLFLVRYPTPRQLDIYKKNRHKLFKEYGVSIKINEEHSIENYLDVTFDLLEGTYKPYHKPNENLKYLSAFSNHPGTIKLGLIGGLSKRISRISANEEIFRESADYYNKVLLAAGYREGIKYIGASVGTN